MPLNPKLQKYSTATPAIASYSFTELVSGQGFFNYLLTNTEDSDGKSFKMSTQALPSADTNGLIDAEAAYAFKTTNFILPQTANGTAYVSCFVDWGVGTITGTFRLKKEGGTSGTPDGIGSNDWSDTSTKSSTNSSYVLIKTIMIDGFIHEVTNEIYDNQGVGLAHTKMNYFYEDGTSEFGVEQASGAYQTWQARTHTAPSQEKRVLKMEVWMDTGGGNGASERSTLVYAENLTGGDYTSTYLSDAVTTADITNDRNILLGLPLTKTDIAKDERIVLTVIGTKQDGIEAASSGNWTLDPTAAFVTDETLQLNLPFEVQL